MNKKQVLATLALSTIALAQAGYVSADELAPIDSSAPTTEVVTPTTPSATTETEAPAVQPTAPSATTETEAPAVQPTEPSVTPVDPTTPDTSSTTDKGEPAIQPALPEAVVSDKGEPAIQPELSEAVVTNKGTPEVQPELPKAEKPKAKLPKTTVEANEQGKSQIGTTSTSTGQVVHDVTKEPVETNTGASIVSTQGGNVVLSDGSVVAPEEVGGTVNEDKTISVTDKEGKLKTLPNTGTAKSILTTIGGMLMTAVGYFYKKKLF